MKETETHRTGTAARTVREASSKGNEMIDSVTIGLSQLAQARAAIAAHVPNPGSSCICYKCENARKEMSN